MNKTQLIKIDDTELQYTTILYRTKSCNAKMYNTRTKGVR